MSILRPLTRIDTTNAAAKWEEKFTDAICNSDYQNEFTEYNLYLNFCAWNSVLLLSFPNTVKSQFKVSFVINGFDD